MLKRLFYHFPIRGKYYVAAASAFGDGQLYRISSIYRLTILKVFGAQ